MELINLKKSQNSQWDISVKWGVCDRHAHPNEFVGPEPLFEKFQAATPTERNQHRKTFRPRERFDLPLSKSSGSTPTARPPALEPRGSDTQYRTKGDPSGADKRSRGTLLCGCGWSRRCSNPHSFGALLGFGSKGQEKPDNLWGDLSCSARFPCLQEGYCYIVSMYRGVDHPPLWAWKIRRSCGYDPGCG